MQDPVRYQPALPQCPDCGQSEAVPILYGLPDPRAMQDVAPGSFAFGGCVIGENDPQWECRACGRRFGSTRRPQ